LGCSPRQVLSLRSAEPSIEASRRGYTLTAAARRARHTEVSPVPARHGALILVSLDAPNVGFSCPPSENLTPTVLPRNPNDSASFKTLSRLKVSATALFGALYTRKAWSFRHLSENLSRRPITPKSQRSGLSSDEPPSEEVSLCARICRKTFQRDEGNSP